MFSLSAKSGTFICSTPLVLKNPVPKTKFFLNLKIPLAKADLGNYII